MYLLHQLLLFAAALAATDTHGRAKDLAGGEPRSDVKAAVRAASWSRRPRRPPSGWRPSTRGASDRGRNKPGADLEVDPGAVAVAADMAANIGRRAAPSGGSAPPEPRDPS